MTHFLLIMTFSDLVAPCKGPGTPKGAIFKLGFNMVSAFGGQAEYYCTASREGGLLFLCCCSPLSA